MPPRSAKKGSTSTVTARRKEQQEKRALEAKLKREELSKWIDQNDPLLDLAPANPVKLGELFTTKLVNPTFKKEGMDSQRFDWSVFRSVLEGRTASSPRWFLQLREEDLLAGKDGLEGVTVDCYVIAEAAEPTLSPAEYIVKVHWPYSDAEDNAPERVLSLEGQKMCWRRVVKEDGSDMNVFLLQPRAAPAAVSSTGASAASFGFGGGAPQPAAPAAPAAPGGFSFGFGGGAAPAAPAPAAPGGPFAFGFGAPSQAPPTTAAPSTGAAPVAFSFGSAPAAQATAGAPAPADEGAIKTQQLKTSEVLFALWSKKRLKEMEKEILSGSRIVREGFALDASTKMKVVMQNDRHDTVKGTVRSLLLNRLFAKQDEEVKEMDKWIDECPVYDERLGPALQEFRERRLNELADESDEFDALRNKYNTIIEKELQRIIDIRRAAQRTELEKIESIGVLMKEGKLAEKKSFRMLKYYAKNDVMCFRPFGKISGISEMGEAADVCVPPAHVNINPFTGKPTS